MKFLSKVFRKKAIKTLLKDKKQTPPPPYHQNYIICCKKIRDKNP